MADRYGVPYQGSKNKIAKRVVGLLPSAPMFYDVFAGGCAITHAAIESGKYSRVIANDYDGAGCELFARAARGDYHDERRWISREDFIRMKGVDPYVRLCWSFSNSGDDYLYSHEVEPWKRALHYARVFGDFAPMGEMGVRITDASRQAIKENAASIKAQYIRWYVRTYHDKEWDGDISELCRRTEEQARRQAEVLRQWLCDALRASGP